MKRCDLVLIESLSGCLKVWQENCVAVSTVPIKVQNLKKMRNFCQNFPFFFRPNLNQTVQYSGAKQKSHTLETQFSGQNWIKLFFESPDFLGKYFRKYIYIFFENILGSIYFVVIFLLAVDPD